MDVLVPEERIELSTYPLPRGCATTTLLRLPTFRAAPEGGCYSVRIWDRKGRPKSYAEQGFRAGNAPRQGVAGESPAAQKRPHFECRERRRRTYFGPQDVVRPPE